MALPTELKLTVDSNFIRNLNAYRHSFSRLHSQELTLEEIFLCVHIRIVSDDVEGRPALPSFQTWARPEPTSLHWTLRETEIAKECERECSIFISVIDLTVLNKYKKYLYLLFFSNFNDLVLSVFIWIPKV